MMMKPVTRIASAFLFIIAAAHLLRLVLRARIMVEGTTVPMWFSVGGFLGPGILAILLWRESRR